MRNVLHQDLSRTGGVESAPERGERARAEAGGQTMDLDASFSQFRGRDRRRPDVNAVAARNQSARDQPRVIRDPALLGRILATYDVPGRQASSLLRLDFLPSFIRCGQGSYLRL